MGANLSKAGDGRRFNPAEALPTDRDLRITGDRRERAHRSTAPPAETTESRKVRNLRSQELHGDIGYAKCAATANSGNKETAQPGAARTHQTTRSAQPAQTAEVRKQRSQELHRHIGYAKCAAIANSGNKDTAQPGAGGTVPSDSGAGSAAPRQFLNATNTALPLASSKSPAGTSWEQTELAEQGPSERQHGSGSVPGVANAKPEITTGDSLMLIAPAPTLPSLPTFSQTPTDHTAAAAVCPGP
ncbi:uncharacterized protein LOC144245998 [Lonchura striata]